MRIIAGRFRRRKLLVNPGDITRPITDRAKETLFQLIEDELFDRRVADIFAGTGSLGLEALSRGAASVVFIESDRPALELLRQNIAMLGLTEEVLVWPTDAVRSSYKPKGLPHLVPLERIFFDPPYKLLEGLTPQEPIYRSLVRLARPDVSTADARIYVRVAKQTELPLPPCWQLARSIKISSMRIDCFDKHTTAMDSAADPAMDGDADDE